MKEQAIKFSGKYGPTFRAVLVNTIGFFPFLLFMGLSDGHSLIKVLPFVCFYTCKIFGVFLIREVRTAITSVELLKLSLGCGLIGSLLMVLGDFLPFLYSLAGILIGLSASWLATANATFKRKSDVEESPVSTLLMIGALLLLLVCLNFSGTDRLTATFGCYALLYLAAYLSILQEARREEKPKEELKEALIQKQQTLFSPIDFIIFGGMCLSMFSLRMGRILKDGWDVKLALGGFLLFLLLFLIRVFKQVTKWRIPAHLNLLTFLNGAIGNFLFLFGSLYVVTTFGKGMETTYFYIPYALGMILSIVTYPQLSKKGEVVIQATIFLLTLIGLWSLLLPKLVFFSFSLISYSHFLLNTWLMNRYFLIESIPDGQQALIKSTTQSKGALIHQFGLMGVLILVNSSHHQPFTFFLRMTNPVGINSEAVAIFSTVKIVVIVAFTVFIGNYLYLVRKTNREK